MLFKCFSPLPWGTLVIHILEDFNVSHFLFVFLGYVFVFHFVVSSTVSSSLLIFSSVMSNLLLIPSSVFFTLNIVVFIFRNLIWIFYICICLYHIYSFSTFLNIKI